MNTLNEDFSDRSELDLPYTNSEALNSEKPLHPTQPMSAKVFSTVNFIPRFMSFSGTSSHLLEIPNNMKGKRISELTAILEKSINDSLALPVGYLESALFDLCREYYFKLDSSKPVMGALATMHPIVKLLEVDDINSSKWTDLLDRYLKHNKDAFKDYKFMKNFIQFLNDLSISWDISNIYNYRHRLMQELEYIGFIDLNSFFTGIIIPEVIWLCLIVNSYPLNEILNEEIRTLALLLQCKFIEIFKSFMTSNKAFIKGHESIQAYLAYLNPELYNVYNFSKPAKFPKPEYQKLCINFSSTFLKKKSFRLKQELEDFELIYRCFESSLIISFCDILGLKRRGSYNIFAD